GADVEWRTLRKWKNGRELSVDPPKPQATGDKKREKDKDDDLMEPFSAKWSPHYSFQLLRKERIWGREAYVLRVSAYARKTKAGNGLAWIDANDFVELKGEFVPAKLPDNADWAKFQIQYLLQPSGVAVPTLLKFEGAGHKWVFKRGF